MKTLILKKTLKIF